MQKNPWKLREKLGYYYMPIFDIQNDEGGSRSSLRDVMKYVVSWFKTSLHFSEIKLPEELSSISEKN